jgi:glyoxylase-like metal-dependent hydrolase (beta-lactamase superfamily II)
MTEPSQRISNNIYLVQGKNNGKFPFSHSILIFNNQKEAVLIDTGCGIEKLHLLKKENHIYRIINSHTHPDHSAGNWLFQEDVESIDVPLQGFNTSGNILALSERFTKPGEIAKKWRDNVPVIMGMKDCKPTHSFSSYTEIAIGDITLIPLHTPGHTIDHYCFYEPNDKILFSFDIDLTPFGPWYGHHESSIIEFKDSIKRIRELDIKILVSSHRSIVTDHIYEQLESFCMEFDERTKKIRALLQEGVRTLDQLIERKPIYGSFPYAEPLLRFWEGEMIKKHIIELQQEGEFSDIYL